MHGYNPCIKYLAKFLSDRGKAQFITQLYGNFLIRSGREWGSCDLRCNEGSQVPIRRAIHTWLLPFVAQILELAEQVN